MQIDLELEQARAIATRHFGGTVNVITRTKRGSNPASLAWWQEDPGERVDRPWAQEPRDRVALATYRDLSRYAVEPVPAEVIATEFRFRNGQWGRPDKDIIKVGLRDGMLDPIQDRENRLLHFRITERGLLDLAEHGFGNPA